MKPLLASIIACAFLFLRPAAASAGRYVSLCPSTTEILFALGAGDEVTGVSRYCNYPVEAHKREHIGDFSQPNIEKIVSLKPDIVFCTGLEQAPSIAPLRKLGLRVYVSDPSTLEELYASIMEIGGLIGKIEQARTLVASMRDSVRQVRARGQAARIKPKVFFEIWHDPLMTAGKGSFIDEMIAIAGGVNVCADTPRPYSRVSEEKVVHADPEVIIMLSMIRTTKVSGRFGWKHVKAVSSGRLYNDIDADILCRPSPRLVEGLRQLQERILQ
jgi:iron complex transport system substrate-binding protein